MLILEYGIPFLYPFRILIIMAGQTNNFHKGNQSKMTIEQLNAQYGKIPPQAIEVEEAVLGALMLEKSTYILIADILRANSFYKEEHQKIFKVIQDLVANEKP